MVKTHPLAIYSKLLYRDTMPLIMAETAGENSITINNIIILCRIDCARDLRSLAPFFIHSLGEK